MTHKKNETKDLIEQINYLESIIKYSPAMIYWKDLNSIYLGCNQNFIEIVGLEDCRSIVGQTDYDLPWGNQADKFKFDDQEVIKTGSPKLNIEDVIFNKKGEKGYVITNKVPLQDKNKKIIGVLGIATDITERKILENELRSSKTTQAEYEMLKNIIKYSPDWIYWKDKKSVHLGSNEQFAKAAGLSSSEEMTGKTDYELPWFERAQKYQLDDQEVINSGTPQINIEDTVLLCDQKEVIVISNKVPLRNAQGEIIGILGIATDITHQKKIEQDLETAKERAEIGEKAKTDFIANISHDMRTPLSGIISVAYDLEGDDITEKDRKELSVQLAEAAESLLEMFEEILEDVAAEHMTENDLKVETFDIDRLVDRLVKLEKPSLNQKGLKFLTHIDPNIPQYLVSDRRKLHRIVLNLIGNAVKFTKQGHIELNIELIDKNQVHITLKFHVIDTGIGVPKESQKHLFDRFYKANPSYQTEYKGFGLGLHIAQTYTHLLGGTISFESTEDVGSDFYAIISLKTANEEEIAIYKQNLTQKPSLIKINTKPNQNPEKVIEKTAPTPAPEKSMETQPLPDAPHVLIIEDNLMLRRSTVRLIKKHHLNVADVDDGTPALELAKTQHFDLIFSDVGLIEMSGIEFTQKMRAFEKENNKLPVPIIGVTAHAADGRSECIDAGMNAVIQKPLTPELLTEILQKFLPV